MPLSPLDLAWVTISYSLSVTSILLCTWLLNQRSTWPPLQTKPLPLVLAHVVGGFVWLAAWTPASVHVDRGPGQVSRNGRV